MRARDYRHAHRAVLLIAEAAQRERIKHRLVKHYAGGERRLEPWDDFRFSLVLFYTRDVVRAGATMPDPLQRRHWASTTTPSRYLKELAEGGFLDLYQDHPGSALRFRFNRAKCDAIASEVYAALCAEGILPEPAR